MGQRRNGFYSIRKHARAMCRYIFLFTPVIQALYPENTALQTALALANDACEALVAEIDSQAVPGV